MPSDNIPTDLRRAKSIMKKMEKKFHRDVELEEELTRPRIKNDFVKQTKKLKTQKKANTNIDMDHLDEDLFEVQDVSHGDESMAVKPYIGALYKPNSYNKDVYPS